MSKRNYEKIWNLLSKYDFVLDEGEEAEVMCILCRKILVNATQGPCGCRYCKRCMEEYLNDGARKCLGSKPECGEDELEISGGIETDHRANRLVASLKVRCVKEGCHFRAQLSEMEEHIRLCGDREVNCFYCTIGCDSSGVKESTIKSHFDEDNIKHARLMVDWMENIKNELSENTKKVEKLEKDVDNLKEEINKQNDVINAQASVIENQRRDLEVYKASNVNRVNMSSSSSHMNILEERINMLTKVINTENEFIWKVDQMSVKVKEARMGVRAVVYSDPFYSHKYGYKLRLSMHPNGYGSKEGTHLYVLFSVMKGEYDDLLSWPLKRAVLLSIIDRNDGHDYCSYRFVYDDTEPSFRGSFMKPTTNMNMAMGNDEFVKLDCLFQYQNILREDNIFIKCVLSL